MNTRLKLEVVTPDKVVTLADADYVGLCGVDGAFGIMPSHIPLLAALDIGFLYYRDGGITEDVFIGGGFVEVMNNHVLVLAESAEKTIDIDKNRALEAQKRAEQRLSDKAPDLDVIRAEASLKRAVTRLKGTV